MTIFHASSGFISSHSCTSLLHLPLSPSATVLPPICPSQLFSGSGDATFSTPLRGSISPIRFPPLSHPQFRYGYAQQSSDGQRLAQLFFANTVRVSISVTSVLTLRLLLQQTRAGAIRETKIEVPHFLRSKRYKGTTSKGIGCL
jgi:hypothetical protein